MVTMVMFGFSAQNYHSITAHLEAGMQLGIIRPTEVVAL